MESHLTNKDLAPVSPEQKRWTFWNIAALWVGMAVCIPTYTLASGLVDQGWSWQAAVSAVILGNVIVLVPMLFNAHAGTRYGIPFPVLLRASFGIYGANIPALMRALVACGWFGIQTWVGGSALYNLFFVLFPQAPTLPVLVPEFFGITTGEFISFMLFWFLNVLVIYRGIESIRILETWAAPFLLATGMALFLWAIVSVGSFSALISLQVPVTRDFWSAIFGAGITTGVAYWGTLALNIPDFSRYARTQRDQIIGQSIGLVPTMALFAFIGAVVTNATFLILGARVSDPVQLIAQIGGPFTTALAMLGVIIATLTTNLAANIVSPANDFSNLCPRLISFRRGAMIAALLGIVILPWKLYNDAAHYLFTWLIGYGSLLGSVAGIMITDYYFIRKMRLHVDDLYQAYGRYRYSGGFNIKTLCAMALGIAPNIPGFLIAFEYCPPSPFCTALYERGWFVSFILAGLFHYLFNNKQSESA